MPSMTKTAHSWNVDRRRILVAHPGRQHSHQAALGLLEAGLLGCYATGVPVRADQCGTLFSSVVRRLSVYDRVEIPIELVRLNMVAPVVNRLLARTLPEFLIRPIQYETYRSFDRWVANLIAREHFDAVIAYENSALQTFRQAKSQGMTCILDAASLHRVEADRRIKIRMPSAHKKQVDRQKDLEVTLADCVVVTSELAAESYRSNIDARIQLKTILLGTDTDLFTPKKDMQDPADRPFAFAFVGAGTLRKGFDLLLEAIERLRAEGHSFEVVVAGNVDRSLLAGRTDLMSVDHKFGVIGHKALVSVLRDADCLVLPSRFDSFGLVVTEAMACGLPVIVSDMVGAKQIVEEGQNGFVVPAGDAEALANRMRWFLHNQASIGRMSIAARASAEALSWTNYRRKFAAAVQEVLQMSTRRSE